MTTSVLVKDNVFPNVYDTVHVERSAFVHVAMFACVRMSPHLVHFRSHRQLLFSSGP